MTILFDPTFPPSLLTALDLILNIDRKKGFKILAYTSAINDGELVNPVLFLFDESKKGIDNQTRLFVQSGYRVFAFKLPPGQKRQLFLIALTVLSLFPKALELMQENTDPFLYTFRYKARKFNRVKTIK